MLRKRAGVCILTVTPPKVCGLVQKANCASIELKAILFALLAFGERPKNRHVKVLCDNSTAVTYINARNPQQAIKLLLLSVWDWCVYNKTRLTATHIAGVQNIEADKESRSLNDRTEWTLKKIGLTQITTIWSNPEIDPLHSCSLRFSLRNWPHVLKSSLLFCRCIYC